MAKSKDPTVRLAKEAQKDPTKMVDLIERTADGISPEAEKKLGKAPAFSDGFLDAEAKRFGVPRSKIDDVVAVVSDEAGPAIVVEEREWSMEGDVKDYFRELYEKEIQRRKICTFQIREERAEQMQDRDGNPTGREKSVSVWRRCGAKLENIAQALVHQSLHLMYDCVDPRTQRAMTNDIRELLFPTREKSVRAALSPAERRQMMANPDFRDRIQERLRQR